jgi:hypothetical protein
MIAEVSYCERWSRHGKYTLRPLSEDAAKKLHRKGKLMTVLIGSPEHPRCFLEVVEEGRSVGVTHLDSRLREATDFSFTGKHHPQQLFLSMATFRKHDGDTDTVTEGTSYIYKPDGKITIRHEEFEPFHPHRLVVQETRGPVAANWELLPEFGQWESIARLERGLARPPLKP